ncbi:hypothetical protein BT67DRAFT_202976 [Trichocladium antarcticum]|uniref:Uncharacterized protein n=1 Tax=Trichocladium antarcticum TaxID=1450529 RepID=A0AAN6ZA94_9PEZI|nr:hypothetical protein BT67DRAFT_202976 [Trichocladium antarcticum]
MTRHREWEGTEGPAFFGEYIIALFCFFWSCSPSPTLFFFKQDLLVWVALIFYFSFFFARPPGEGDGNGAGTGRMDFALHIIDTQPERGRRHTKHGSAALHNQWHDNKQWVCPIGGSFHVRARGAGK